MNTFTPFLHQIAFKGKDASFIEGYVIGLEIFDRSRRPFSLFVGYVNAMKNLMT
jgi:hypothetical protein